ncbi:uncharacterized protein LOC141649241 [Silene latifolia]|uniref:uncharacterized protein LOC141649241 n=1 Tax=Silene latifolia TaxID=37657 RepID=UPI003D7819CF
MEYIAQFILANVISRIKKKQFYLTMVYAFNDGTERTAMWQTSEQFQAQCQGPLAIAGDFNTVINPAERLGGNTKQSDMDEFIDFLSNCGMIYISASGAYYTWTNKQELLTRVYRRLDRFIVNQDWSTQFPDMNAHFHPAGLVDHCPCIVSSNQVTSMRRSSFKYFNLWGKATSFLQRVQ